MIAEKRCCCSELDDLAIIGMGDSDGLDQRVFATLNQVQDHGGVQWWLYVSSCSVCNQGWMIAQEERIHDNFLLKRVTPAAMREIVQDAHWPDDFLRFEQVLRLEREAGNIATFMDPRSPALVDTVIDLRRERPDISIEDIAYALAISAKSAERLLKL